MEFGIGFGTHIYIYIYIGNWILCVFFSKWMPAYQLSVFNDVSNIDEMEKNTIENVGDSYAIANIQNMGWNTKSENSLLIWLMFSLFLTKISSIHW